MGAVFILFWMIKVKQHKEKNIRTLCYKCKQDYISAGYLCISLSGKYKEPCEICGKAGYDYEIRNRNVQVNGKHSKDVNVCC